MSKSPGQDELDTLRDIARIARQLEQFSFESYTPKNKDKSEWDEYDMCALPLWIELTNHLNYLDL